MAALAARHVHDAVGLVAGRDHHALGSTGVRRLHAWHVTVAGELVGGVFYFNYPGGTGLTNGAVFGRIAGTSAARAAAS